MPSDATNRATRREWRELGFFYKRNDQTKTWELTGSREGLLGFRDLLLSYATDRVNALQSEHEHYGPYAYLKIMTCPETGFDKDEIRGSVENLARLASLVRVKLATARPGSVVRIQEEFVPNSPYALILDIREDQFDPASIDTLLPLEEDC